MERASATASDIDANWLTASASNSIGLDASGDPICGTPKNANWAYSVTATPSPTLTPSRTPTSTRTRTPTRTPTLKKTYTPTRGPTSTKTPNRTTPEPIILNEFLAQPRADWNGDGKTDSGDGFIELRNLSTTSISISGYRLDDQEGGSLPYTIKETTMQPGTRKVFFASETGILLSTGGDSVRLFKSSGSRPSDAFTYSVIKIPNQTWCRLPDDTQSAYYSITWRFGCEPTLAEANKLAESVFIANRIEAAMCLSKTLPLGVYLAECDPLGLEIWSQLFWDALSPDFPRFLNIERQEFILE